MAAAVFLGVMLVFVEGATEKIPREVLYYSFRRRPPVSWNLQLRGDANGVFWVRGAQTL